METDDFQLLREFVEQGSEPAFSELVRRHVSLVYSVAWRHTTNAHRAEEITQAVFIILARKASSLKRHTILSGWLFQTARLTSANFLRAERRRAAREQEAYMQSLANESAPSDWSQLAPVLDEAVAKLGEKDRNAVVLRFLEGKSLGEVGASLGVTEDAAKMRVNRALEKLKRFLGKRGAALSVASLATALSANAMQSAPLGLAATSATAALLPATSAPPLVGAVLKAMTWIKVKTATAFVLSGAAVAMMAVLLPQKFGRQPPATDVSLAAVPEIASSASNSITTEIAAVREASRDYVLANIGTLPGFISSRVSGMNNHGQVVGWQDGSNGVVHAFFWDEEGAHDLGTLGGSKAIASGINDLGEIVAVVLTNQERRVFVLRTNGVTDLGVIDGFAKLGTEGNIAYSPSVDINNLSQVTGRLMIEGDNQRSFLFSEGQTSYFGLRGDGSICYAKAMNNCGQIAGQSHRGDSPWGVFLWERGEITELETLGGPRASINAINDHGTVVGWANPAGAPWDLAHAIIWEKGKMYDLNASGWKTSRATSINNTGEVVGYATTQSGRSFAFVKRGEQIFDLNELVATNSGWHLFDADEINDRGQILARGKRGKEIRTFLVSPSRLPIIRERPTVATSSVLNPTAAVPAFNLSSLEALPNGTFRLGFIGDSQGKYQIEASTNLTVWTVLGETENKGGRVEFIDRDAARFSLRFYRAVRVE